MTAEGGRDTGTPQILQTASEAKIVPPKLQLPNSTETELNQSLAYNFTSNFSTPSEYKGQQDLEQYLRWLLELDVRRRLVQEKEPLKDIDVKKIIVGCKYGLETPVTNPMRTVFNNCSAFDGGGGWSVEGTRGLLLSAGAAGLAKAISENNPEMTDTAFQTLASLAFLMPEYLSKKTQRPDFRKALEPFLNFFGNYRERWDEGQRVKIDRELADLGIAHGYHFPDKKMAGTNFVDANMTGPGIQNPGSWPVPK